MSDARRNALEARDHGDGAFADRLAQAVGSDIDDLRLAMGRVGEDAGLRAGEAHRVLAAVDDRHAEQRDRDALT